MLEIVLLVASTAGGRLRSGSRHRRQGDPVPGLALDRDRGHVLQESPVTQFQLVVVDGPSPVEDVHQAAAVVAKSEKGGPSLRERDIGELEAGVKLSCTPAPYSWSTVPSRTYVTTSCPRWAWRSPFFRDVATLSAKRSNGRKGSFSRVGKRIRAVMSESSITPCTMLIDRGS